MQTFRIYRDIRFTPDPTPYKVCLSAREWKKIQGSCLKSGSALWLLGTIHSSTVSAEAVSPVLLVDPFWSALAGHSLKGAALL